MTQAIGEILKQVFQDLSNPAVSRQQKLTDAWPQIMGKKWSSSTRPVLKENGVLCVWANHAVLAFELKQKYAQAILKRAQAVFGEEMVKQVMVRVGR